MSVTEFRETMGKFNELARTVTHRLVICHVVCMTVFSITAREPAVKRNEIIR